MTISYIDHDGVSSLLTLGRKGTPFFYVLCYAVGAKRDLRHAAFQAQF